MHASPNYSEIELLVILDSVVVLPSNITESVYENQLRDNSKLTWRTNPFLSKKQNLLMILSADQFRKWEAFKKLNWLIAIGIIFFSLLTGNYKFLWTLLIFPLFTSSGIVDHWIVLFNLSILFLLKYFIGINSHFFWFAILVMLVTYVLSRLTQDFVEKSIFKIAFGSLEIFWKYYSNRLIYVNDTRLNEEYRNLILKYPDLNV
jgi:hypothetical protein